MRYLIPQESAQIGDSLYTEQGSIQKVEQREKKKNISQGFELADFFFCWFSNLSNFVMLKQRIIKLWTNEYLERKHIFIKIKLQIIKEQ